MRKKVTSTDIAKAAGVSQATVSMVLNKSIMFLFQKKPYKKWNKLPGTWATLFQSEEARKVQKTAG